MTQPDRPSGRGMRTAPSPVKLFALEHALEVFQPENLRNGEAIERLHAARADAMVVAAYGLLLPQPAATMVITAISASSVADRLRRTR